MAIDISATVLWWCEIPFKERSSAFEKEQNISPKSMLITKLSSQIKSPSIV
ncbi:hypothetical protein SBF1_5660001 [Candidatus Desulfosporosinus infrequens]|uniref:Uncharacterized protein n=1 Tax=Candidatus Desulfosporosinus infrequens TaxID=2043169 RepID=A0A2U3LKJ4_9FIRM|nr:hypothetical protein SBF1_5660001 [Candidatus Desulfosporosinus infrequens]